ncbi:MAG: hypothetical protein M1834_008665 [Cirrosporium novae-zelandiae]|nr:MAG: hypothetical protein M1834_008665 [Cirrosporium novae-zelandiae]
MFAAGLPELPSVPTRRALLVLDPQKEFLSPSGKLPIANAKQLLRRVSTLATSFRGFGDVVWVKTEFQDSRPITNNEGETVIVNDELDESYNLQDMSASKASPMAIDGPIAVVDDDDLEAEDDSEAFLSVGHGQEPRFCLPNTSGAEFADSISPLIDERHDRVFVKSEYSAFATNSLLLSLRMKLVTELYICGSLSNISVYATASDAVRYGFSIILIEDCLGFRNPLWHRRALKQMFEIVGAESIRSGELLHKIMGSNSEQSRMQASASRTGTPPGGSRKKHDKYVQQGVASSPSSQDAVNRQLKAQEQQVGEPSRTQSLLRQQSPATSKEEGFLNTNVSSEMEYHVQATTEALQAIRLSMTTANNLSDEARVQRCYSKGRVRSLTPDKSHSRSRSDQRESSSPTESQAKPKYTSEESRHFNPITEPSKSASKPKMQSLTHKISRKEQSQGIAASFRGPSDTIGSGDSRIILDVFSSDLATSAFKNLKSEIKWQTMAHRAGDVPRLVAVQGTVNEDGSVPIYRHPADESPPLHPFSPTVLAIKTELEAELGKKLNHVLIQLYRTGEDNISEHSDKTLDIAHGSDIVNASFGAQRVMTLRTKKDPAAITDTLQPLREVQRVALPNNSVFVLGLETNRFYLHGIRPDKRPVQEKTKNELAYEGQRISLTFRQIRTFLDEQNGLIWGQGAKEKDQVNAHKVISSEEEVERMVIAFGKENHRVNFDWEQEYGEGFDVVNFVTKVQDVVSM